MKEHPLNMICDIPRTANIGLVLDVFIRVEILDDCEFKLVFYKENGKLSQKLSPYLTTRIVGIFQN